MEPNKPEQFDPQTEALLDEALAPQAASDDLTERILALTLHELPGRKEFDALLDKALAGPQTGDDLTERIMAATIGELPGRREVDVLLDSALAPPAPSADFAERLLTATLDELRDGDAFAEDQSPAVVGRIDPARSVIARITRIATIAAAIGIVATCFSIYFEAAEYVEAVPELQKRVAIVSELSPDDVPDLMQEDPFRVDDEIAKLAEDLEMAASDESLFDLDAFDDSDAWQELDL